MNNKATGKCQCGKISYSLKQDKVISGHHCHCKDCQRATGSGKATILFIARKYIDIKGDLKYFESKGSSGSTGPKEKGTDCQQPGKRKGSASQPAISSRRKMGPFVARARL